MSGWCNIKVFLVTKDIEKDFDFLDYSFLTSTLKMYGFGKHLSPEQKFY